MKNKQQEIIDTILFSLFVGILSVLCAILYEGHDGDFNWYCVLGKDIVNGNPNFHGIDIHSWIAQERGFSEMQHSWLGTVIAYSFSVLIKPFDYAVLAFIFLTAVMCSAMFKRTFLKSFTARPFLKLAAYIFVIYVTVSATVFARTRSFDCLFFALIYYLLLKNKKSKYRIIFMSIVSLLWANIHGSSILFYFAFLFIFFVLNAIPDFKIGAIVHKQNKNEAIFLILTFVSSVLLGTINPYGIKLYSYALFENTPYVKEGIGEWSKAGLFYIPIMLCLIIFLLHFVILKKEIEFKKILPVVMLLGMTGIHIRMGMYMNIALIPIVLDIVQEIDKNFLKDNKIISNPVPTLLVCASCLICVIAETLNEIKTYEYYSISDNLIEYLNENQYERTYNDYDLGAYLIFNGIQDFVDARADFFDEETLTGARKFNNATFENQGDIETFLQTFKFDAIILNQQSAVTIDYLLCNNWRIGFKDEREDKGFNYVVLIQE